MPTSRISRKTNLCEIWFALKAIFFETILFFHLRHETIHCCTYFNQDNLEEILVETNMLLAAVALISLDSNVFNGNENINKKKSRNLFAVFRIMIGKNNVKNNILTKLKQPRNPTQIWNLT